MNNVHSLESTCESPRGALFDSIDSCLTNLDCVSFDNLSESVIDSDTSETISQGDSHNVALSKTLLMKRLCSCLDVNYKWDSGSG